MSSAARARLSVSNGINDKDGEVESSGSVCDRMGGGGLV
jgi:hypothetical protein